MTGAALRQDRDHWEMRGPGHRTGIGPARPPPQQMAREDAVFLASCVLDLMDFNVRVNTVDITGF